MDASSRDPVCTSLTDLTKEKHECDADLPSMQTYLASLTNSPHVLHHSGDNMASTSRFTRRSALNKKQTPMLTSMTLSPRRSRQAGRPRQQARSASIETPHKAPAPARHLQRLPNDDIFTILANKPLPRWNRQRPLSSTASRHIGTGMDDMCRSLDYGLATMRMDRQLGVRGGGQLALKTASTSTTRTPTVIFILSGAHDRACPFASGPVPIAILVAKADRFSRRLFLLFVKRRSAILPSEWEVRTHK